MKVTQFIPGLLGGAALTISLVALVRSNMPHETQSNVPNNVIVSQQPTQQPPATTTTPVTSVTTNTHTTDENSQGITTTAPVARTRTNAVTAPEQSHRHNIATQSPTRPQTRRTVSNRENSGESATSGSLTVRRLAVAHSIEDRQPIGENDPFIAGQSPVYAWVEMANSAETTEHIVVEFAQFGQHGSPRGLVQLEVPPARRWRTWGFSRRINTPGTWTAVIRTLDGHELARTTFEVTGT